MIFYPRSHCTSCGSRDSTRRVSQGQESVYTFTVIMQSRHPAFAELGPYAVAYVDLDEGFRIMTNIVGVQDPTRDIQCGMRVKLRLAGPGRRRDRATHVRAHLRSWGMRKINTHEGASQFHTFQE